MATAEPPVVSKIRKLLALAHSPNEHEAASAAARAQALLTEHRLTLDDVEAVEFTHIEFSLEATWEIWLVQAVSEVSGCRLLVGALTAPTRGRVVGPRSVVEATADVCETLRPIVRHLRETEWAGYVEDHSDPLYGVYPSLLEEGAEAEWKDSFALGVISRLLDRMRRARDSVVTDAPAEAHALIKLDGQLALVDAYVQKTYDVPVVKRDLPHNVNVQAIQRGFLKGAALPLHARRRVTEG